MDYGLWMPDSVCVSCYSCESQFTFFNRKHHCRKCGQVFCNKCCFKFIEGPQNEFAENSSEEIRVCNNCYSENELRRTGLLNFMKPSTGLIRSSRSSNDFNKMVISPDTNSPESSRKSIVSNNF